MILALDPGERKVGWALVDGAGRPRAQGIAAASGWAGELLALPDLDRVSVVVVGDGTARSNIEAELRRLLPGVGIAVVDERGSTVEGWQLKRAEQAGGSALRAVWLSLAQLFSAPPVDDYAARVLARRYLGQAAAVDKGGGGKLK